MKIQRLLGAGFLVLVVGLVSPAFAAVADLSSFNSITNTMLLFIANTDAVIQAVFLNGQLSGFVYRLWTFFSILLISWFIFDYIFGEVSLRRMFDVVLTIGITKVLIDFYDPLTTAFWNWSIDFADGIQIAAVGNADLFFLPGFLVGIMKSISFTDFNILTDGLAVIVASIVGLIMTALLAIVSIFTSIWAIWGYAVAKMIGWMFIPTLMFERLEWLFNGWLRLFFGFLIYGVIARVNLILVALVFKSFLGISISTTGIAPIQVNLEGVPDIIGLACFLLIGVVALLSTGRFAMTLAGGGSGSGGGGLIRAAVSFATGGLKG